MSNYWTRMQNRLQIGQKTHRQQFHVLLSQKQNARRKSPHSVFIN